MKTCYGIEHVKARSDFQTLVRKNRQHVAGRTSSVAGLVWPHANVVSKATGRIFLKENKSVIEIARFFSELQQYHRYTA